MEVEVVDEVNIRAAAAAVVVSVSEAVAVEVTKDAVPAITTTTAIRTIIRTTL